LRKHRLGLLIVLLFAACFFADWTQDRYDFARTNGVVARPPVIRYGVMSSSAMDLAVPRSGSGAFLTDLRLAPGNDSESGSRIINGFSSTQLNLGDAAFGASGVTGSAYGSSQGTSDNILGSYGQSNSNSGTNQNGLSGTTPNPSTGFTVPQR
jgi:hypothetical protein